MADPRAEVRNFLSTVRGDLDYLVENYRSFAPPEMQELAPLAVAAWGEARVQLTDLERAVQTIDQAQLDAHGLSGNQLLFKLRVWQRAREIDQRGLVAARAAAARGHFIGRHLDSTIEVVKSVASVIPGVGPGISEIIDVIATVAKTSENRPPG